MTNIIGQVAGGTISNGQGWYGASLLPDTFKKILLTLAEDRCANSKKWIKHQVSMKKCIIRLILVKYCPNRLPWQEGNVYTYRRCSPLKRLTAFPVGNQAEKVKTTNASFDERFYDNCFSEKKLDIKGAR